ncbi:MAG: TIGR03790 family protein [Pseudomonadota bacterium]
MISQSLAVVANQRDPESIEIAKYYIEKNSLSDQQLYLVDIDPSKASLSAKSFKKVRAKLESQISDSYQFYLFVWPKPYKVDCMSITSAFAFGFDKKYCSIKNCSNTAESPYFNSKSKKPFQDFKMRPSMLLAYDDLKQAKALIDRGVLAKQQNKTGKAYLVSTSDRNRNVRSLLYELIHKKLQNFYPVEIVEANSIKNKKDVMFYFTGLKEVPHIQTNTFLPGAIADHLTSTGGVLFGGKQMSVLEWIDAGVSGSYGTVTEPCNFPQKFPNPYIVIGRYLTGETLIESYWKSVKSPGEGLFVGDPLVNPFKRAN